MTPFDWGEYLILALRLADEPDEASRRSAISRAYYSCYGLAATYALLQGFPYTIVTHDRVWEWYVRLNHPSGGRINEIGKRIKDRRLAADYRAHDDIIATQARLVCGWADELVTIIRALPEATEPQLAADAPPST